MDKAMIFGIYDFVSFQMGRALLNMGLEVIGIHINENNHTPYLEEKRLEVGRNANFREILLSELDTCREVDTTETTLILSLYDLYMLREETIFQKQTVTKLQQFIEGNKSVTDIVFLLPIQLLVPDGANSLRTVINEVVAWGKNNQFYYLPAIYGPWQPSTYTFQQALLANMDDSEIRVNKREWTGDILYVDDAVEAILVSNENLAVEDNRHFLIESGLENYWVQCAAQLKLETKEIYLKKLDINQTISRVTVKKVTPFSESFEKQIEMTRRLI
ncbi:hypothetical protein L1999_06270 [Neobacillus drentensis]|uniref:hypothetical protein n=1 Tax=Neobacillus drentensis TaxID=220684 RepID=UPI001F2B8EFE|nr:hypothetical protein [Neobacillus drentensis]ULT58136.1 hypothetical protein L1999_06270 [Neobacillus drentensis]